MTRSKNQNQSNDFTIEIIPVIELNEVGELIQSIIPNATRENIKSLKLDSRFVDTEGNMLAVVQCFVIKTKTQNILVDTGNGNNKERLDMPEWGNLQTNFLEKLQKATGLRPQDIDIVINTHLHFDHIGWNTRIENKKWKPTFENAKYLFVENELNYWLGDPQNELGDDLRGIKDSIQPIIKAGLSTIVSNNHQLSENIRLIAAHGHTPGHICVEVESNQGKVVIGGDIIYHPSQIQKINWTAESDWNPEIVIDSRKRIFDYIIKENATLLGMHFEGGIKLGKVNNQYFIKNQSVLKK